MLSEDLTRLRVCLDVLGSTDGAGFSEPLLFHARNGLGEEGAEFL